MNEWKKLLNRLPRPLVVTLIGGGGKTGLMNYLVNLLASSGAQVVATTTTKLSAINNEHEFAEIHNVAEGRQLLKNRAQGRVLTLVGGKDVNTDDKMVGIPGEWVDQLAAQFPNTYFVVEGDGSAGRSLKGHLSHEPVIPTSSRLVIPIIGIDVIGLPLNNSHVHRPERVTQLIGARAEDTITNEMVIKLLFHPEGYLKNCPFHCLVLPFINKVEELEDFGQAQKLAQGILSHGPIERVIIGSLIRQVFTIFPKRGGNDH